MKKSRAQIFNNDIIFYNEVVSTNDALYDLLKKGLAGPGTVLAAKMQSAGRGRYSRKWISKPGGVYFSVFLDKSADIKKILSVSLIGALSVIHALEDIFNVPVFLKWPNDVILQGKKISGVLTDIKKIKGQNAVITGIGINTNQELGCNLNKAVSLKDYLGKEIDNNLVINKTVFYLKKIYRLYKSSKYALISKECAKYSFLNGKKIIAENDNSSITGIAEGIDIVSGCLMIRDNFGKQIQFFNGSVKVIK